MKLTTDLAADRRVAAGCARVLLPEQLFILDTETTGLDYRAEVIEVAVVDSFDNMKVNQLLRPSCPIPREATEIHGIKDDDVTFSPSIHSIEFLNWLLRQNDARVAIYNAAYDTRLLEQSLRAVLKEAAPGLRWQDRPTCSA